MFKNAKIIAIFTLLSRVFGYFRDLTIASYFGASIYTDMFFIAFRIPNSLRRFLGEGAINSSVIPVLSKLDEKQKTKAIWNLIFYFLIALFVVTVLGVFFSKFLIAIFAAGYLHNHFQLMNKLVRLIFPYIFFIGLTVLLMGILNSFKHFAIPAFAPTLLNISIIVSVVFLFGKFTNPIYAICVGVIIGGILQLLISGLDFLSLKQPVSLSFRVENTTIEIFKLMGIAALGSSIIQVSTMVDGFVASFLKSGSFSYIFYANRLFQLPFAVFSIALAQGSLPDLSKMQKKNIKGAIEIMSKFVVFYSAMVTLYLLFFSFDVVKLLFMHGKFNISDAHNVSIALDIMIAGFLFFSLTKIFSNAFYSRKDAKTPLKATVWASIVAIVLSFALGFTLGFIGLAISMSISGIVNFFIIYYFFNKKIEKFHPTEFFDKTTLLAFTLCLAISSVFKFLKFGFIVAIFIYVALFVLGYKRYSKLMSSATIKSS